MRDDRKEAERHHGNDDASGGDGVAGELFQKRLDRLRLVERVRDPPFRIGQRDRIERDRRVVGLDHPLQIAEGAAEHEAVRDGSDAVEHDCRHRLQKDAPVGIDRVRVSERGRSFIK